MIEISVLRLQADGRREVGNRSAIVGRAIARDAAIVVRVAVAGIDRKRSGVVSDGVVQALELVVREAAIEKRLEVAGD